MAGGERRGGERRGDERCGGETLTLPLTLSFPCRAPGDARSRRHPVVIGSDWTVRTGHDEDLERIAQALGGGMSCRPALAAVLPGFRVWWERTRRCGPLPIRSADLGERWTTADAPGACCPPSGYAAPDQAAAHARTPRHVATVTRAPVRDLTALVAGLGPRADPAPPPGGPLLAAAWECGLSGSWVEGVLSDLAGVQPVTVRLLVALAQTGADPAWVASTMQRARAPDAAEWLAWTVTPSDVAQPGARATWMGSGTRRTDIVRLSQAGYTVPDVAAVARLWRLSVPGAAQLMARWAAAGYRPTPEQLAWVEAEGHGFAPSPPGRGAVDRVAVGMGLRSGRWRGADGSAAPAITQLAVALARWGTVADTVAALREGAEPPPPTP